MFSCVLFFFFTDTATTEIYTLSLHDALPILTSNPGTTVPSVPGRTCPGRLEMKMCHISAVPRPSSSSTRSEEHTSELQSHSDLVCRLLLEKKKKKKEHNTTK